MSVEDKQRLDNEIKRRETRSVDNQKMSEEIRSAKDIAKEREKIEEALKSDEEAAKSARDNGNYAGYQKAVESQKKRQEQLDSLTANIDKNIRNLDSEVKQLDKDLKDEKKIDSLAKGEVKYSRQIAHLKTQQDSVWNKKWNGVGGGVVGGVVGGAASILGAGAVVGFSEAGAYGSTHKEIVKAIEKEYGKDGSKKYKKQQRIDALKDRKEADKDIEGEAGGGDGKKGEDDAKKE
jgi:hypothetical protein